MKKQYEICLRLSEEERDKLISAAKTCGLTKSKYLRSIIMGQKLRPSREKELNRLIGEMNKIGSNVNQIARAANMGQLTTEKANEILYLLDQVYKVVEAVVIG